MSKKLNYIFNKYYVLPEIREYILGTSDFYNKSIQYSDWSSLIISIYKGFGLESEYTKRAVDVLFKSEDNSCENYFSVFKTDINQYIKAIKFLVNDLNFTLSKSVYYYLSFESSPINVQKVLSYFYSQNSKELENTIFEYVKSHNNAKILKGYEFYNTKNLHNYLDYINNLNSTTFKEKLRKHVLDMTDSLSILAYLPFFNDEDDKKELILSNMAKFLAPLKTNLSKSILSFLETGEKNKDFEKSIKSIKGNYFTELIVYFKPNPDCIYTQRLIEISAKIDSKETVKKLLFTVYNNKFTYKLRRSNLDEILNNWDGINFSDIINFITHCMAINYYEFNAKKYFNIFLNEDSDRVISSMNISTTKGIYSVLDSIYQKNKEATIKFIWDNIDIFKGKALINKVARKIFLEKNNNEKIIKLLNHKKTNVREIAVKALIEKNKLENDNKNIKALIDLKAKEKAKAVLEVLKPYLADFTEDEVEKFDYYSKNEILKRAEYKSKQNDFTLSDIPKLIWAKDNSELSENFSKHLIYLLRQGKTSLIATEEVEKVISLVTLESFRKFLEFFIDDFYKTDDWYLRALPFTKDDKHLDYLKKYIKELIYNSRGATAAKVVNVIAKFKTTKAMQLLDFLSLKKNARDSRVNDNAYYAINAMAKEMNLTKEDLFDSIIPDFGFDKSGSLILDYGKHKFTVSLEADLTMIITSDKGKTYKNLPKISKDDDLIIAQKSTELFKLIKKDLKAQVKVQRERLENGFSNFRTWKGENWLKLFVNNPIMRVFAKNLVWGIYKDTKLTDSFRYLEDNSFSNVNDDELNIKNDDTIALVHPAELSKDELIKWNEIFDDYEIIQSFEQINREVFKHSDEDKDKDLIDDFKGFMIGRISLRSISFNLGWSKGELSDGSNFYYYDKNYGNGIYAYLEFYGDYIYNYDDDSVPIYDVKVYENDKILKMFEIPRRLYSELYSDLKKITDKGSGFNADWESASW